MCIFYIICVPVVLMLFASTKLFPYLIIAAIVLIITLMTKRISEENRKSGSLISDLEEKAEITPFSLTRAARWEAERRDDAIAQAKRQGVYVCDRCKTIDPKRCSKCKACLICSQSSRYEHLCNFCWKGVATRECAHADNQGEDVCWDCLTVDPLRCRHCDRCIGRCNSSSDGKCWQCRPPSDDD